MASRGTGRASAQKEDISHTSPTGREREGQISKITISMRKQQEVHGLSEMQERMSRRRRRREPMRMRVRKRRRRRRWC